jgi:hypothetical protein
MLILPQLPLATERLVSYRVTAPLSTNKWFVRQDKGFTLRICLFCMLTMAFVLFHNDGPKSLWKMHTYPLLRSQIPLNLVKTHSCADSPELSPNPNNHTTSPSANMSAGTNTAPAIGVHMLVQLLLCIGLPMVILPTLTAIGYFGFRYLKSRRNARMDVERGDCIKMSTCESSTSDGGSEESKYMMTPALVTNSVQVPASAVVRNS